MTAGCGFKRTLLVSDYLPGSNTGAPIILANLLAGFPSDRLWILTFPDGLGGALPSGDIPGGQRSGSPVWRYETARSPKAIYMKGPLLWLQARYRKGPLRWIGKRVIGGIRTLLSICLIPSHAAKVARMVRGNDIEIILTIPAGPGEICIAAYLAHRQTNCPLYFFAMDDWQRNARRRGPVGGWLAGRYMAKIACDASRMWAISSEMARGWHEAYGADAEVLWHSIDVETVRKVVSPSSDTREGFTVGVVASLYWVNIQPFHALVNAIEELRAKGIDARIRLITTNSLEYLASIGIEPSDYLAMTTVPPQDIPRALTDLDVLFLGLTFEPADRRTVEVAFPTKLPEYMASGHPILVNAPAYAEASRYVRENDCGLVIESREPQGIASALVRLTTDAELRSRLTTNALDLVVRNHDREKVVARFLQAFAQ
jgi:glycosyltransferase involved in cell wall biosynthesis